MAVFRGKEPPAMESNSARARASSEQRSTIENFGTRLGVGAVIVLGALGLSGCAAQAEPPKPAKSHSAEASPPPVETEQPLTIESVEIKAGLSPEQLGETFIQRLSDWKMAGATDANYKLWRNAARGGVPAGVSYVTGLAQENSDIYAQALFGSNWQGRSDVAQFVPNQAKVTSENVLLHFQTAPGNSPLDLQQYKTWVTTDSVAVLSQSDNVITEKIIFTEYNNARANRAAELSSSEFVANNGEQGTATVSFALVNGVEQVTSFQTQ